MVVADRTCLVDLEDKIVVAVDKYHLMMNIADQMLHKNVTPVVCFVALDHLLDKHAFDDYFQFLILLKVHWVYHKHFFPKKIFN